MKRKGFLKNFIGALCVGALISMPVIANAAEEEDILGCWSGGSLSVKFNEDGTATDNWNTRNYHMGSGSLTVTYNNGNTETVVYDLWRGEQINNVSASQSADAVIYKIIGSGQMQAWNVYKESGSSDWKSYDPGTLTKVTEDKKANTGSSGSDRKCEHHYEWRTITEPTETADGVSSYICTFCGKTEASAPISADVAIRNSLLASIKNAEAGTTVIFDNKWHCYPQYVLDALKEKGNVSLKTNFTYEGKNYSFTIPAGSDYTNLEQADFYGFMYLLGAFDGIMVE